MRHWLAAVLLAATAGSAAAQSYQTALPLSPAERRSLEARLSTILDYARADEITRFELPSGRSVTVLPYRKVRRADGNRPCRGYRIDLEGRQSRMAVDGFRCKRRDGDAWVIVEPELVLAQEGPADTAPAPAVLSETRTSDEPLYPSDDLFASPSAPQDDGPPPLPRPAPRSDIDTATAPAGGTPAATDPNSPFASRVAALLDENAPAAEPAPEAPASQAAPQTLAVPEAAQEPADAQAAKEPARPVRLETTPERRQREPASQSVAAAGFTSEPTRVVSESDAAAAPDFSRNEAVVAGLRDLDYLIPGEPVTADTVEAAVDAFSVDERFALPVSADVLIARIDSALERSETLPDCAENSLADLCAIRSGN